MRTRSGSAEIWWQLPLQHVFFFFFFTLQLYNSKSVVEKSASVLGGLCSVWPSKYVKALSVLRCLLSGWERRPNPQSLGVGLRVVLGLRSQIVSCVCYMGEEHAKPRWLACLSLPHPPAAPPSWPSDFAQAVVPQASNTLPPVCCFTDSCSLWGSAPKAPALAWHLWLTQMPAYYKSFPYFFS